MSLKLINVKIDHTVTGPGASREHSSDSSRAIALCSSPTLPAPTVHCCPDQFIQPGWGRGQQKRKGRWVGVSLAESHSLPEITFQGTLLASLDLECFLFNQWENSLPWDGWVFLELLEFNKDVKQGV